MPTTEYLEALLNSAKKYLPSWLMTELHKLALPSAGGKARWREPEEPSFLEKMALADIRPEKLKDAPEDDVRMAWLRLHQWYGAAKKRGDPVEGVVNAALFALEELERRGIHYDESSDLVQEARKLQGVKKAQSIEAKLANLPAEVVVVPNFVSVVGSAVSKEKPNDIDVLIRANRDGGGEHFLIQSDNVWLPVRKVLDPEKKGTLHFIDSPQGSHADFVPCYSLVLRREDPKRQVVKEGGLLGPIHVVGGKSRIADEIIALFPEHTAYVEPYAGGAKVFWAKEPSPKEVLNDSDAGIMSVYRFIKGASDEELTAFAGRNWEANEERFDRLANSHPQGLADHAYRVWYISRFGFQGAHAKAGNFIHARGIGDVANVSIERLQKLQERLKDVALLNMDALSVIKEHDAPSTLFYLDPPYPAGDTVDYPGDKDETEHFQKLVKVLASVRGKFILSCNKGSLDLVEASKAWTIKEVEVPRTATGPGMPASRHWRTGHELLVMNFKPARVAKAEALRVDLGCRDSRPDGYLGIDKIPGPKVDKVADLESGIPLPDASASEVRANHVLEHLSDKERIMAEVHRVLKPGGRFVFEVPSTKGEGAFAHPSHRSWWNKSAFAFWTQDNLLEGRPKFEVEKLEEIENGDLVYVRGILRKPEGVSKAALEPFDRFVPPKPQVALYTELYTVDELWEKWAKDKGKADVEPKLNGFRSLAIRKASRVELWFEGQMGKDQLGKFPGLKAALEKVDSDFILDCDIGILRGGKREPRPDLMRFNADKPEFAEDETPVLTAFDLPYWQEDLHDKPFEERRESLEEFDKKHLKGKTGFGITEVRWVETLPELKVAARWAFSQDRSEGLVAKTASGKYELDGVTDSWSKLKKICELKVKVLEVQQTKTPGTVNYYCGLLPSVGMDWKNTRKVGDKEYIDLGKTFSTSQVKAQVSDVITVEILELLPDEEKKHLAWLGARPVDVDDTRKEPYTAAQAIDVAERGQVLQKSVGEIVPGAGPKDARIMFVGASPGATEAARGEPFVGPAGAVLNESYLTPLGLSRKDVFLTNTVPLYLTDEKGNVREPTPAEVEEWKPWLARQLDEVQPGIVVALGQTAKAALGDRADFTLPHPSAIRRFGDSGELARKLKQIGRALEEVKKADPKAMVEEAYASTMRDSGENVERHSTREVASESGRSIWRINDGWGERYYLVESGKARWIAVKMPDVGAFNCEPPLDKVLGKAQVKELGWSDDAWDRALARWLKTGTIEKADDEGETTAEAAAKFWADNWFRMFPPDGKGRYTYHHHFRGLSEDESKLDEKELLDTSHSLHGDLRFEADGKLWGFSVFLGTTQDNRRAGGDRLTTLPQDDNLQGQFKLAQPSAWLDVGVGKPMVTEPGGVGATSEKYSKFFAYDRGAYEMGCWREHMFEVFLHGEKLKGRFLVEFAPIGGRRVWLIDKPTSQTPYAKAHDLADVTSELRGKGQRHLIWRDPEEGGKPRLIDVTSARVAKEYFAQILKADDEKQLVYGVVLEPETVDTQGDVISADEIEKAAHRFLVKSRVISDRHSKKADAEVVESYVAPDAFEMGGQKVKKGSWVLGVHVSDSKLWSAIKQGEYQGFSVGGFGVREAVA